MELKATKGISLKRSSMGSKKRKNNSFKRQKRRKAADIKYSMTEITRMTRNRPVRPKKLKTLDFENDKEELLRLMKRIRPTVEKEKEYLYKEGCAVCSKDHFPEDCPCLDKIPPGTDLGPLFDRVCNCCGKIGDECCRKGAYAILTRCDGCENIGHWYWENRCPKDWCRPSYLVEIPSIQELEHEVMQNKNKVVVQEDDESDSEDEYDYNNFYDDKGCLKRLKTPDFEDDKEELLRLMKRIRPTVEKEKEYLYKEGCAVCSKDHFPEDCPCLDKIPPGTVLGPLFDRVCNCCGKIGDECCRKGAYAILTRCDGCENTGHWYWENRCPKDWCRPSYLVEIPSIQELEHEVMQNKNKVVVQEDEKNSIKEVPSTEQSLENSLQNKEEDDVMVDVGEDNKNKDEVMVEDDDSNEDDEAKGGKESSNQNRSEKKKNKMKRKAMLKLGMKPFTNFGMTTIKLTNVNLCSISKPNVFKSPNSNTYVKFGEAKIEDLCSQLQAAARQLRMPDMSPVMAKLEISGAGAASPADEEEAEIDETGVGPRDIDLVMTQEQGFQDSQFSLGSHRLLST